MKINPYIWFGSLFLFSIVGILLTGAGVAIKYYSLFAIDHIAPNWVHLYLSLPGYISLGLFVTIGLFFSPKIEPSPLDKALEALLGAEKARLESEIMLQMSDPSKSTDEMTKEFIASFEKALEAARKKHNQEKM